MYEGPIKAAHFADGEEAPILRQLRWTDLVARIAAKREIQVGAIHLGAAEPAEPNASFAGFHRVTCEGQHTVNRDALAHGKLSRILPPEAAKNAGHGDRETR